MTTIKMTSGEFTFLARLEEEKTPESSRWLLEQLPLTVTMIQGHGAAEPSLLTSTASAEALSSNTPQAIRFRAKFSCIREMKWEAQGNIS